MAIAVGVVAEALAKLSRKSLLSPDRWVVSLLFFMANFAFGLLFPVVMATAAVYLAATGNDRRREYSAPPATAPARTRFACSPFGARSGPRLRRWFGRPDS